MTDRSPYQRTLLGDDPGSVMAWQLYRAGYERGVQSGHAAGYAEGVQVLRDASILLASYEPWRHPTHSELDRRRSEARDGLDRRTGPQTIADAHASWAALDRKDAAA